MLSLDISNLWSGLSLPDLLGCEPALFEAHSQLFNELDEQLADWMWLNSTVPQAAMQELRDAANRIRTTSDALVVIGTDAVTLGIRGVLELLRGCRHNDDPTKPRIYFTGGDVSTRDFRELTELLDEQDFSVCYIHEDATESALAFRSLKWKLTARYGEKEAHERIYVITDTEHLFSRIEGITICPALRKLRGRYSLLSAVSLLPLLVEGVDTSELLRGAEAISEQLRLASFDNPAWLYCAGRQLLRAQNRTTELLVSPEPCTDTLSAFWQNLFLGIPGPLPMPVRCTRDAHLTDHHPDVFETYFRFEQPEVPIMVESQWDGTDTIDFLEGRSFGEIAQDALDSVVETHSNQNIPAFLLECGQPDARTAGELLHFAEFSAVLASLLA